MISINKIALDYGPRKEVFSTPPLANIEMSEFESAFLCGLLRKFKPKKIVECGVAAGGTTAIILKCLENIGQEYSMKSIDISEVYYRDKSVKAGSLAEPIKADLKFGTHEFYLGTVLPLVIDEVGGDIDFLILDTTHSMPGEGLDFMVALPYLKENAVVCMHDVSLNQRVQFKDSHATTALFSAVTANKFLNFFLDENLNPTYPNIAAFQITEDTMKNIENVFLTLILRWRYLPDYPHLRAYTEMLMRHYPSELFMIFQEALRLNLRSLTAEAQLVAQQK